MWFSPIGNKDLRKALVRLARGKEWADIEHVRDEARNATTGVVVEGNKIPIEEFCKYKYVIYTDVRFPSSPHYESSMKRMRRCKTANTHRA